MNTYNASFAKLSTVRRHEARRNDGLRALTYGSSCIVWTHSDVCRHSGIVVLIGDNVAYWYVYLLARLGALRYFNLLVLGLCVMMWPLVHASLILSTILAN